MKKFIESKLGKMIIEILRWGVLAFASTVITKSLEFIPGLNLDQNTELYLTMTLRFVDSLLHKSGVAEKGITRF